MSQKTALVTGASSGIGEACACLLTEHNYKVINADLHPPNHPSKVDYIACDVSDSVAIDRLYTAVSDSGVPDVLISNAGIGVHEKLAEGDPEKWQQVIMTNLMGPLRVIRAFLPDMLKRKSGHIIFISSVAAGKPHAFGGVYAASKTALEVIAETLRLEVQPTLKVSVVAPGAIDTPFFENTLSGPRNYEDLGWEKVTPEDVARHVAYLLSLPRGINIDYSVIRPNDQSF